MSSDGDDTEVSSDPSARWQSSPDSYQLDETVAMVRRFGDRQETVATEDAEALLRTDHPDMPRRLLVPTDGDPALGDQRYVDFEVLGHGSAGVVFAARDRNFDREVAIKVARQRVHEDLDHMARFIQEARVTASLEHPNILPVHDIDITGDGRTYFTMRKAAGHSLADRITQALADPNHPPPEIATPLDCVNIMDQVCNAVAFAHDRGIVHQDIKPGNIVLGDYGEVLLVDWGTALTPEDRADPDQVRLMGTPAYMAPEQARRECVDERSDIYCLGATFYHLLTRCHPTWSDDRDTFWEKKKQGIVDYERIEDADLPPHLVAIAMRALEPEPDQRYQDVHALQADLRAYRDHRESIRLTDCERKRLVTAESDLLALADSIVHLDRALELWRDNRDASALRRQARQRLLLAAIEHEDVTLARQTMAAAAGDLDDYADAVARLQRHLDRRRIRRRIAWTAAAVASVAIVVLGILLLREWQRTSGSWYQIATIELGDEHHTSGKNGRAASGRDRLHRIDHRDGTVFPIDEDYQRTDGLYMLGTPIFWLKDVFVTGDVRVTAEVTWGRVDGFAIFHHASRGSRPSVWQMPRGYGCQFGAYRGAYSYLTVNRDSRMPQALATAMYDFVAGQRYALSFERDGDVLRMAVDGEVILEEEVFTRVMGAHADGIGLRSWGDAILHSVTVERRAIPAYDSPLARADGLVAFGHWAEAAALYRQIGREHAGTELGARALAQAIVALIQSDQEQNAADPMAVFETLKGFGFERHTAYAAESLAAWRWREGRFHEALGLVALAFDADPETQVVPRLLHERRNDLPADVRSAIVDWLGRTSDLSYVNITGMGISDLSFLAGRRVRILKAGDNAISDCSPLAGAGLWDLDLSGNLVRDLSPLAGQALRTLDISGTRVQDLSPLRGMPLRSFFARATPIDDIAPVAQPELRNISINHTNVTDLTPLQDCQLQAINASNTRIEDLSPLRGQPLRKVELGSTAIKDLSPLSDSPLQQVDVPRTMVTDLKPLMGTGVWNLDVAHCPIDDWAFLADMDRLVLVDASHTPDPDLSLFAGLSALEVLRLEGCALTDLTPLAPLAGQLTTLDVEGNPVRHLGPFLDQPPQRFEFDVAPITDDLRARLDLWRGEGDRAQLARRIAIVQAFLNSDADILRSQATDFQGHRYLLVQELLSFEQAAELAVAVGGYLVKPDDEAENQFLRRLAEGRGFWIGVEQTPDGWRTTRGESVDYRPLHAEFTDSEARYWNMVPGVSDRWLGLEETDPPHRRTVIIEWDE